MLWGRAEAHCSAGEFSLHRWPLEIHFENENGSVNADCLYDTWVPSVAGLMAPFALLPNKIRTKQNNREGSHATRFHSMGLFAKRKIHHCENRNRTGSRGLSQASAPAFSKFKKPGHYQVHILSRDYLWNTKHSLDCRKVIPEGHRDTKQGER